jgi:hypothetical protein
MIRGAMRADSRLMSFFPTVFFGALLAVGASPRPVSAAPSQETAPAEAQGSTGEMPPPPESSAPADEPSVADRTPDELSDAERLLRMQQVVTLDEAKLERLRTDLASRNEFLNVLTGQMAEFQATWEGMSARLEELEPGSEEATSLRDDIKRLEQQYERFNRHASLTFEAEGALRTQIRSLEGKIQTDRRALAVFRGTQPIELGEEAEAPAAPSEPPASPASRGISPDPRYADRSPERCAGESVPAPSSRDPATDRGPPGAGEDAARGARGRGSGRDLRAAQGSSPDSDRPRADPPARRH